MSEKIQIEIGTELSAKAEAARTAVTLWTEESFPIGTKLLFRKVQEEEPEVYEVIARGIRNSDSAPEVSLRRGNVYVFLYPLTQRFTIVSEARA
jgi:hypothetical protein